MSQQTQWMQKEIEVITILPPPQEERVSREARFYPPDLPRDRYALPESVETCSPVGFRQRVYFTKDEMKQYMPLLSLEPPVKFEATEVTDQELFEESSLGIMNSRQSTNYNGHMQRTFGPEQSREITQILRESLGESAALDEAAYTHITLSRAYKTPFTLLLTFAGHKPLLSLLSVPWRALKKRFLGATDIPTISYLRGLHLGILADGIERAVAIASQGARGAHVLLKPFCGEERLKNAEMIKKLTALCQLSSKEKSEGWEVSLVSQVGKLPEANQISLVGGASAWRKIGAALLALRSERIQPGVNHEPKAPPAYHRRQTMDVSEEHTIQAGRAAYNAFSRWLEIDRDLAKDLLLNDRVDVLTPSGKNRLRKIRRALADATDCLVRDLPLWVDLPTGKLFSRNANKGRKAFALAGQRIYLMGLSGEELQQNHIDWNLAICATGAAAARSALYSELMGCTDVPEGCDMLAGVCLMAGPVNQNDIGKTFYGHPDLLDETLSHRGPTSLLVWTLKAKTVADPVGNEEQLLNPKRKGALVDLRPAPHQVVSITDHQGRFKPFRSQGGLFSKERAFSDIGNLLTDPDGVEIKGNAGEAWPHGDDVLWEPLS